jgi:hypothetical protein
LVSNIATEGHRLKVFENKALRCLFGTSRNEVTGGWRKLHKEKLVIFAKYVIRIIKSRRMRWKGHVALTRRSEMHIGHWLVSQKERDH